MVGTFLRDLWMRLKACSAHASNPDRISMWDLLLACELADPIANGSGWMPEDRTWLAVKMVCKRFDIASTEAEFQRVKVEILAARDLCTSDSFTANLHTLASQNLLAFCCEVYGEHYGSTDGSNTDSGIPAWKRLPLFAAYAKAVFCIMVSSAIVEPLFSEYGYTRSKARSSMTDGTAASILLTHELDDIVKSVREPFSQIFALRAHALTDRLNWS